VGWLLISTPPIFAQESPVFEKIRDLSPDGKFALRISCIGERADPDNIKAIQCLKPGVLLLEQFDIFRGGISEDAIYQFTAKFDEKADKLQIT
jgi:hypothetical protein